MGKILNLPVAYQACVIAEVKVKQEDRECLVCHDIFVPGDLVVIFDRNGSVRHTTFAHGPCIRALSQYFVPDEVLQQEFDDYRVKLLNRYASATQ